MNRHRHLFKENSALQSPREHNRLNREFRGADRKAKRDQLRMAGRNIPNVTPSPRQPASPTLTPICAGNAARSLELSPQIDSDKENTRMEIGMESEAQRNAPVVQSAANGLQTATLLIAKAACSQNNQKLTRQEAYLKRFVEWKQARKQEAAAKKQQSKPLFKPAGAPIKTPATVVKVKAQTAFSSFAPNSHVFKAPAGLKSTDEMKKAFSTPAAIAQKLSTSLYTVVPTPPKKKNHDVSKGKKTLVGSQSGAWTVTNKAPTATPSLPHKTPTRMKLMACTSTPKPGSKGALNGLPNATAAKPLLKQKTPSATSRATSASSKASSATPKAPSTTSKAPSATSRATSATSKASSATPKAPSATSKAPSATSKGPSATLRDPSATSKTTLNIGSAKLTAKKAPNEGHNQVGRSKTPAKLFLKPSLPPPVAPRMGPPRAVKPIKAVPNSGHVKNAPKIGAKELHAKLATTLKAKRTGPVKPKTKRSHPKLNLNKQTVQGMLAQDLCLAETPTYTTSTNAFNEFVTSTKHKESHTSQTAEEFSKLAKTISPVETVIAEPSCVVVSKRNSAKRAILQGGQRADHFKFNFIQNESANISMANLTRDVAQEINAPVVQSNAVDKANEDEPISPVRDSAENPINYMSPFVTVSRGRFSLSAERKKRDEVYLQTPPLNGKRQLEAETPVEVRRTLEAVRYFRLQVLNEVTRLRALCDTWDIYKDTILGQLEETGGVDMINMTIGQTNLLIEKKFKQFTGLIDRCEAAAKGQDAVCDGGEDTKPVTAVDLEGFWSMVGLQIDNVGKRFENLEKWKANNWQDPDEPVEVKVKPVKGKKPRAAPAKNTSSARPPTSLQQMLRKLAAETRKKRNETSVNKTEPLALTPTRPLRPRNSKTPVIVQDRKSRSPVPTRVCVRSPARSSRSMLERKNGNELLKAAIYGAQQKDRQSLAALALAQAEPLAHSPERLAAPLGRKSILKTPGTAKRQTKSVFFNNTPQVKRFDFVLDAE